MDWASPRGIRFDPGKYKVMHFRKPLSQETPFAKLPPIPRLIPSALLKEKPDADPLSDDETSLRILGVQVDHRMNWLAHIDKIEARVNAKMDWLSKISKSPWGPDLLGMRRIYLSSVRPIMTYACAA